MSEPTLLVIDIGNTNVSIGVFDYEAGKGTLTHHWRTSTHREQTSDEAAGHPARATSERGPRLQGRLLHRRDPLERGAAAAAHLGAGVAASSSSASPR